MMDELNTNKDMVIDPVCIIHGRKFSEHDCLYCCMCFKPLTPEQCMYDDDGIQWDVCVDCNEMEKRMMSENQRVGMGTEKCD